MNSHDLIVVGAGIHGAGVAQAAAAAGLRVLILEQYARPATGTSCKSSKLIHGGLRYLETAQLSLVYECLRERGRLLRNAPDLVRLVPFYIPIYRHTTRRPWQIRAGLSLYALLGGFRREARFRKLPRSAWHTLDGLDQEGLQAVFRYYDGQTDDAALTCAVIDSARQMGAKLMTESRLVSATLEEDAVVVTAEQGGRPVVVRARALVNAAGPWANTVLSAIHPPVEAVAIELVQGTHIVVPGDMKGQMYYLEAPSDRRAVFVMPWGGQTLIGTTETLFRGDPADVQAQEQEIEYLLETFKHYFPGRRAERGDVVSAFAGLRVLPMGQGAAFSRPRDTRLHVDRENKPRVLTIYGGKLTTYRATAIRVMHRLGMSLPRAQGSGDTRRLKLTKPGKEGEGSSNFKVQNSKPEEGAEGGGGNSTLNVQRRAS